MELSEVLEDVQSAISPDTAILEARKISWYENRETLARGTVEEWEVRVHDKLAAHMTQTVLMNKRLTDKVGE